jgi:hypothetical protein
MWKRFLAATAAIVFLTAVGSSTAVLLEVDSAVDAFNRFSTPLDVDGVLDDVDAGPAADDHGARLRTAVRRSQGGHQAPVATRSSSSGLTLEGRHGDPQHPTRPQGDLSAPGRDRLQGQDQRRVRDRRPPRDRAQGQGGDGRRVPDPPRREHQLRRLHPRGQPPRLLLRRHRPPLLQRQQAARSRARRTTRRSTCSRATRSSAARTRWTSCASATSTRTSCAARASSTT